MNDYQASVFLRVCDSPVEFAHTYIHSEMFTSELAADIKEIASASNTSIVENVNVSAALMVLLWACLTKHDECHMILCNSLDVQQRLISKLHEMLSSMPGFISNTVKFKKASRELSFPTASKIFIGSSSHNNLRGRTLTSLFMTNFEGFKKVDQVEITQYCGIFGRFGRVFATMELN